MGLVLAQPTSKTATPHLDVIKMLKAKIVFVGWCKTNPSDKVWGIIELSPPPKNSMGTYLIFWGRRGTRYQTRVIKSYPAEYSYSQIFSKILEKKEKGYRQIENLEEVYESFQEDLEGTALWTLMTKGGTIGEDSWDKIVNDQK